MTCTGLAEKDNGPSQPILPEYPKRDFGKQKRSFSAENFKKFPFIEYSKVADAVFCFPCRHFPCNIGYKEVAFVSNGVWDWKNIGSKLQRHVDCDSHKQCMEQWQSYLKTKTSGSVAAQLNASHKEKVKSNREYATTIVEILLYHGKQGLALRGHDEKKDSANRGNFLELCTFLSKHNEVFKTRFNAPFNLTSHESQNELLEIAAEKLKSHIICDVEENGFFTILVDEARSFKQEQIEEFETKEQFMGFVDCSEAANADAIY